jgi:hypothetical protein
MKVKLETLLRLLGVLADIATIVGLILFLIDRAG